MSQDSELQWSSALSVGDPKLDGEHRAIIEQMSTLRDQNSRTFSKEKLLESFDALVALTRVHFQDEERHMAELNYPDLERHKRIHEQLYQALDRYRTEFSASVYGRFPSSVFDFFQTWLVTHIMIVDQQYAKFRDSPRQSV
jgi:hemerythrin